MVVTLTIELGGNIAAGKTSVLNSLSTKLDACAVDEPVDEWRDSGLLKKFYDDPAKFAFEFQMSVIDSRAAALNARRFMWRESHGGEFPSIIVCDRWLAGDRMFAEVNRDIGNLSGSQFAEYMIKHNKLTKSFAPYLDVKTVWLEASVPECQQRIVMRNRAEEQGISPEYLARIAAKRPPGVALVVNTTDRTPDEVADIIAAYAREHWLKPK